jgi:hypothetical protein
MAQEKPEYEVNDEFNNMAVQIVEKFPEKFDNVDVGKVCCVNLTNKTRKEKDGNGERIWKLQAVKMPIALHCTYGWYVVLHSHDWDDMGQKHKLALVADVLHGLPNDLDNEGKVNPCDTKGYRSIFRSLGLDYLEDPDIPNILDDGFEWK